MSDKQHHGRGNSAIIIISQQQSGGAEHKRAEIKKDIQQTLPSLGVRRPTAAGTQI